MSHDRFWRHVDKNGPVHPVLGTACWLWTAYRIPDGYGRTWWRDALWLAHRRAWTEANGEIPDGIKVLHRCDNPACVRIDHLFLGDSTDNARDREAKGRGAQPRGDAHGFRLHPDLVPRGEENGRARLTADQVIDLRRRNREGASIISLARSVGMSFSAVRSAIQGETWKHVE